MSEILLEGNKVVVSKILIYKYLEKFTIAGAKFAESVPKTPKYIFR